MCVFLHVCLMPSGTHTNTHTYAHTEVITRLRACERREGKKCSVHKRKKKKCIHAKKECSVHIRRAEILYTDHAKEEKEKKKKKISCAYTQSGDSIYGSSVWSHTDF